jgi:thiol-disulfide isomerase/thioredoxin
VNGEFSISGKVSRPCIINLQVSTRMVRVLLENTEYTVNSTLQTLSGDQFKGSLLNDQYYEYMNSKTNPLDFIKQFPAKQISAFLAYAYTREYTQVQDAYTMLSPENKASYFGRKASEKIAKVQTTQAGKDLPFFEMTTPDGKKFSVKDMPGKVIVLDFWASWCGPCRSFIPTMREYYNQYHAKGVEFVAVSLDDNSDKWRQAMAETKMEWTQGLAAGGFGEEAPIKNLLNIKSIPHVIVVGKDGKIAAWLDYYAKAQLPEILAKLTMMPVR